MNVGTLRTVWNSQPISPSTLKHWENPRPDNEVEAGEGVIRTPSTVGVGFAGFDIRM